MGKKHSRVAHDWDLLRPDVARVRVRFHLGAGTAEKIYQVGTEGIKFVQVDRRLVQQAAFIRLGFDTCSPLLELSLVRRHLVLQELKPGSQGN